MKYSDIISKLTLKEKTLLCSGKDYWHLVDIERLGIPSVMVTDGPHGLRKQCEGKKGAGDVLGNSVPATCFPTASLTSSSWDTELIGKMGEALGEECLKEKVSVLLGPGVNMKRSPLCGRNFEYFSEDPFLAGNMGAAFINGVQSKGVGTSLKHFAANNQECRRMSVSTVADERALREIYLTAFEIAVKKSNPWTVMNAYNKINGTYCAENGWLLNDVLRNEWGYDGVVVTDWGAENDIVKGLKAGQSLEMPGSSGYNPQKLEEAVIEGELSEDLLNENVDRVLTLIFKGAENLKENYSCDMEAHHRLARKIAGESAVLLKNDGILPLDKTKKIAVIGEMAKNPRFQGAGSSLINPIKVDNAYEELLKEGFFVAYSRGYDKSTDETDEELLSAAVRLAKKADIVLVFAGLTEIYESEGFDRKHIDLPKSHNELIEAVSEVNENVAVVLSGGSAVAMPWLSRVKGVLNCMLGGEASGSAAVDVLSGKVNPSGKLTETYPLSLNDTPSRNNFPGTYLTSEYRESIFIGYRYYDKMNREVLFPFGYGLSYTEFEYSDLKLSSENITDDDILTVSYRIKNIGKVAGAEVSQVYVSSPESRIFKAPKELKGFSKVYLEPGEEKGVTVRLSKRSFAFYNVNVHDWFVESGSYGILIGASSRDIKLEGKVNIKSSQEGEVPDYRESAPEYYNGDPAEVTSSSFESVLGFPILQSERDIGKPIDVNEPLEYALGTERGDRVISLISAVIEKIGGGGINSEMMRQTSLQIPIRCFVTMSSGVFNDDMAKALCDFLNGKPVTLSVAVLLKNLPSALSKLPNLLKTM